MNSPKRVKSVHININKNNVGNAAGTNGQIQFNDNGNFGADLNLFWDNTNKRFALRTNSPVATLHINGAGNTDSTFALQIHNSTGNNNALVVRDDGFVGIGVNSPPIANVSFAIQKSTATLLGGMFIKNSGTGGTQIAIESNTTNSKILKGGGSGTGVSGFGNGDFGLWNSSNGGDIVLKNDTINKNIRFHVNNSSSANMILNSDGGLLIGTSNNLARLTVFGAGITSATFGLQVHNSTGTNNALVVRDDGRVGIGTNNPQATLHISNNGNSQIRIDDGVSGGNGLSGSIQFTTTNTSFIAMSRTGGTSALISIPPNNNNQDVSFLHINYNNSGVGVYLYPRRTFNGLENRTVILTSGDYNNGGQSRGIDFINNSVGNVFSYQTPAFRFYSGYKTTAGSNGLRFQINNVSQARATSDINLGEIWSINTLFGISDNSSISINESAVLDLQSNSRGFLPPRMTTSQRDLIISPATGLIIFNTTDNKHQGFDGTNWNDFY